jgi:vanillin dehydrogenase
VNKVAAAAARAFESWSETGPNARRALLLKAADLMEGRANDFSKLMLEETGATAPWAAVNVRLAAGMLREAAALTTQIAGEVIPADKPGVLAMAIRQPVGVVLGIAPWNAPVILGTRAIAAALACGNTVILRSSELCPGTHHLIGQVLNDAGFPKGVVNVLSNAPEDAPKIVEALIAHPAVKRINFTGSTRVGKIIAKLAAEHLKPVLLELGGKAPLIVLDDADLDQAVDAAAFGAFMNQGQICMSTERIIVDEKVADAFVAKLAAKASKLPAGDPRGQVVLGSLVDRAPAELDGRADRGCRRKGRKARGWWKTEGHDRRGHAARPCHAADEDLWRRIVWPGETDHPRRRRRRGHPCRQRYRIRSVCRGLQPGHQARDGGGPQDRNRHLPYQRADGRR